MMPNIGLLDNEALPHISLCSCFNSNSDDNLLKNIELFDRLSLSFNSRVLFIKDVIGDEICCWSFYGQGRKLAEVCCTSIVYATEKKQTKVRSVEAIFQPQNVYQKPLERLSPEELVSKSSSRVIPLTSQKSAYRHVS